MFDSLTTHVCLFKNNNPLRKDTKTLTQPINQPQPQPQPQPQQQQQQQQQQHDGHCKATSPRCVALVPPSTTPNRCHANASHAARQSEATAANVFVGRPGPRIEKHNCMTDELGVYLPI